MRVIGGTAKGRRLEAPKGLSVRPTLDRVRESLFNILAPRIECARFLDLFAGSGANGIEALSRGAAHATFVDNDEKSLHAIRANLASTGFGKSASVIKKALPSGLSTLPKGEQGYSIVFADPPYALDIYEEIMAGLQAAGLVSAQGLIVLEHSSRLVLPQEMSSYVCSRRNGYGEVGLSFFEVTEEAQLFPEPSK